MNPEYFIVDLTEKCLYGQLLQLGGTGAGGVIFARISDGGAIRHG